MPIRTYLLTALLASVPICLISLALLPQRPGRRLSRASLQTCTAVRGALSCSNLRLRSTRHGAKLALVLANNCQPPFWSVGRSAQPQSKTASLASLPHCRGASTVEPLLLGSKALPRTPCPRLPPGGASPRPGTVLRYGILCNCRTFIFSIRLLPFFLVIIHVVPIAHIMPYHSHPANQPGPCNNRQPHSHMVALTP